MGHFKPRVDFIVKMTKCRQDVHTTAREVCGGCMSQISLRSIFLGHAWSPPWRGILLTFSTDPFLVVLQEIMTGTGIQDP